MRAGLLIAATLLLPAGSLRAELIEIRHFKLKSGVPDQAYSVMSVTPDQDLLVFGAQSDGQWKLTRVRSWADKQPLQETITVPGVAWNSFKGMFFVTPNVLVTPDGRYAVCLASSSRFQGFGPGSMTIEDVVSVVDLRAFALVKTAHPPGPRDTINTWSMDNAGSVVFEATALDSNTNSGMAMDLWMLSVPELAVAAHCRYVKRSSGTLPERPLRLDASHDCDTLLAKSGTGTRSLQEYFDSIPDQAGFLKRTRIQDSPFMIGSPDGRFVLEAQGCPIQHLFGRVRSVDAMENVVLRSPRTPVGEISCKNAARFAVVNGRDYLLLMENNTEVKVYEVTDKRVRVDHFEN